jgi:hypothetical protein
VSTFTPPHTIISLPVQSAVKDSRPVGASAVVKGLQAAAQKGAGVDCPKVAVAPEEAQNNTAMKQRNLVLILGELAL